MRGGDGRIGQDDDRLAVRQDVLDLGSGQAGVGGDQHAAGQRHGEVEHDLFGAVAGETHHPRLARDSHCLQALGDLLHLLGGLGPGEAAGTVDDRGLVGKGLRTALQKTQGRECDVESGHTLDLRESINVTTVTMTQVVRLLFGIRRLLTM